MGGGGDTTTTTTASPWSGAENFARTTIGLGEQMPGYWARQYPNFENAGGVSYQGSRVAQFAPDQIEAMNQIRESSRNQTPAFQAGQNWLTNTLQGSRTNAVAPEVSNAYYSAIAPTYQGDYLQPAQSAMNTAWGKAYNPTISGQYTDAIAPSVSEAWQQAYQPTIQGQYLNPSSNQALGRYVQSAIDPITENYLTNVIPQLRTTANKAGMRGSDIEALYMNQAGNDYMRNVGNTAASMYAPAYESERGRQMQAAQYPSDRWNQERQLQMAAAQYPSGIYGQERQLQMQAAQYPTELYQYERNLEQNALPQATDYWNQLYTASGNLAAGGEEQQKLTQANLDAQRQSYDENKWDMYNMIAALGNLAYTGGQMGGVTSSTQPNYMPGLASNLLGTGSGLAGLYGMYNMLSSA